MTLSSLVRYVFFVMATVVASQASSQGALEIIPLRHRTADQVLPALRPLMEPGATLTGPSRAAISVWLKPALVAA